MGTPLIMDNNVRERIRELIATAQAHPVDMNRLARTIKTPDGKARHMAQMNKQTVLIPLAFMVTFSIEHGHPCGTCRHMSMSVQRKGRVPNEHGLWLVAQEFGFMGNLKKCSIYEEQLLGHGVAINVVQPVIDPDL